MDSVTRHRPHFSLSLATSGCRKLCNLDQGSFLPMDQPKLEEACLVWEGSERLSQGFHVGVLSWTQNVCAMLSTSGFVLSDHFIVTIHCYHELVFFSSPITLWWTMGTLARFISIWFLFKSISLGWWDTSADKGTLQSSLLTQIWALNKYVSKQTNK